MGNTSNYLVYAVHIGRRKDKFGRSYISFGGFYSEIEFTEACFGKLVISPSRLDIL